MRIGYACLAVGVPNTAQRTCIQRNASSERLTELIAHNLVSLENIMDYNIKNDIRLFRISSDLIPFGSSPVNTLDWCETFEGQWKSIAKKIKDNKMRVSMHPGQYTVLNSSDDRIVERAIQDLYYHAKVLECLNVDPAHKIILHIGGVYQDKKLAVERFVEQYLLLDERVQARLVIENDDRSYDISEVLAIGKKYGIPVVFDNLHHAVHPDGNQLSDIFWINECKQTWKDQDGPQKIHYSQQDEAKRHGSHSNSIQINEFIDFIHRLGRDDLDIMLEVKDKNISAVQCVKAASQNLTNVDDTIQ